MTPRGLGYGLPSRARLVPDDARPRGRLARPRPHGSIPIAPPGAERPSASASATQSRVGSAGGSSPPLASSAQTWQNSCEPSISEPHWEQWCFEPAAAGVYAGLEARSRGLMVVLVIVVHGNSSIVVALMTVSVPAATGRRRPRRPDALVMARRPGVAAATDRASAWRSPERRRLRERSAASAEGHDRRQYP